MGTAHDTFQPTELRVRKLVLLSQKKIKWNYEHSMHLEYDKYHVVPRSDMSGGPSLMLRLE